jgi:F-type H+-transporting ATPase subunit delta
MAEKATVARPYARAAFKYASAARALAAWSDALTAAAAVVGDARVRRLIGNPKITSAQLIDFIADVSSNGGSGGGKIDPKVHNFLDELARNRRLGLLPEIAAMFETMRNEVENVADVRFTSAVALTETQRQRFTAALKKRLGKEVHLNCDVDAKLIGGAIIRSGDLVIDGSLRAGLERLASEISQ